MASLILSIDLGSTQFKAGVFALAAGGVPAQLGVAAHELVYAPAPADEVELECAVIQAALRGVIGGALNEARVNAGQIQAIAITSQAQTFTIADAQGQPRGRFISWQDTRARAACADLQRHPEFASFQEHASFCSLIPNLLLCQLRHLRDMNPRQLGSANHVLPLPTFLVCELTGENWLDDNLAAMSGLFSLKLGTWWPAALASCGLTVQQLPKICASGTVVAHTTRAAERYGLAAGIPVMLAGNDQTAGAYGAQVHRHHALLLTLGTALVAYTCSDQAVAPHPALIRGPYPGGRFYAMEADGGGGSLIGWAFGVLEQCPDYDAFFRAAETSPPGSLGLVFNPDLAATLGRWENIRSVHQLPHFARAVLESLVRRHVAMAHDLSVDLAQTPVLIAGGGSHRPLWVHLLGEALQQPVRAVSADPLLGAASLACALLEPSVTGADPNRPARNRN